MQIKQRHDLLQEGRPVNITSVTYGRDSPGHDVHASLATGRTVSDKTAVSGIHED